MLFPQWDELLKIGEKQSDDDLENVLKTIGVNECCTLVYTVRFFYFSISYAIGSFDISNLAKNELF